jgi:ABC-type phosphate transport system auxiliary subunit
MVDNGIIKAQNLQTIVAVSFILALLSIGMNFYNITLVNQLTAGMLDLEAASIKANVRSEADLQRQITELTRKVEALDAELQRAGAAAADSEGEVADSGRR